MTNRQRERLGSLAVHVALLSGSLLMLVPLAWMVSTSLKEGGIGTPGRIEWLPYSDYLLQEDGARKQVHVLQASVKDVDSGAVHNVGVDSLDQRRQRTVAYVDGKRIASEILSYTVRVPDAEDNGYADTSVPFGRVQRRIAPRGENYGEALHLMKFWTLLKNTVAITYLGTLGTLLSCSLVAYGFARFRFPGRGPLFLILLSTMMLPPVVTMIPVYLIFRDLGWIDTLYPLFVPAWLGTNAFAVFLFRQFYMTVPFDLDDAATIDGCSPLGIYWHVLLPLTKPVMATVGIFTFTAYWLDFMGPLIYLNSDRMATLSLGLYIFKGPFSAEWHYLMAATLVVSLPCILLFLFGQRFFIKGVVMSGLKA
jgi:multiple sugar transport system permease protein